MAVRKSESITAEEALKHNVIDFIASDVNDLLRQMDGREVMVSSGKKTIRTKNAVINEKKAGMRQKILAAISDPNIAYILFLIGLAGLYFEFSSPGVVVPGIVGGIALILSFFAKQTLPVNYAGVALIIFAVILFIAEVKVNSHGILTIGGVVSLVLGSLLLFDTSEPSLRISLGVMLPAVTITSLFFVGVVALALKAQLRKKLTGREGMIGQEGRTATEVEREGKVLIGGVYWDAWSDKPIDRNVDVKVVDVRGLKLKIEKL